MGDYNGKELQWENYGLESNMESQFLYNPIAYL